MSYPVETAGGEGSGEREEQTLLILKKNKLQYLLPILEENNTNFDELIEFEDDELQMWLPEISDKFRNKLDKIRFLKSIKEYRKLKQSLSLSSISSPSSSGSIETVQKVHVVTIDTETTQFCNTLNQHIDNTEKGIANLGNKIDEISDLQQLKHKYIEQECDMMIKQMNELKDNILKPKIDEICLNKISILQNQMDSLKVYLKTLNNAQQKVGIALRDTTLNNETRKKQIIAPIKQSVNDKVLFYPNTSPFVDITFNASEFSENIQKYWIIDKYGKPYHEQIEWLQCGSGSTDILLSWKIPNANKQILSSITGYIVYFREMTSDDEKCDDEKDILSFVEEQIDDTNSPTSHSLANLKEATIYRILICSYNQNGKSALSAPLIMKTNAKLVVKSRINQKQLKEYLVPIDQVQKLFAKMRSKTDFSDTLFNIFIRVDRKLFVPEDESTNCCLQDSPIDINYAVSLSAPHIHIYALQQFAYLFESPYIDQGAKFLDVGAGSGYVASLIATGLLLNMNVNKIDVSFKSYGSIYHPELLKQAKNACKQMKLEDILSFHQGDTNINNIGLNKYAFFDGIYCGAGITKHDANLLRQQLTIGGVLMCVVETDSNSQDMQLVKRISNTNYQETKLFAVRFRTLRGRFQYL